MNCFSQYFQRIILDSFTVQAHAGLSRVFPLIECERPTKRACFLTFFSDLFPSFIQKALNYAQAGIIELDLDNVVPLMLLTKYLNCVGRGKFVVGISHLQVSLRGVSVNFISSSQNE